MNVSQQCGFERAKRKRDIQKVMDAKGKTQVSLASDLGISRQAVSATINGIIHSPAVLDALREIGVPASLLFDPRATRDER